MTSDQISTTDSSYFPDLPLKVLIVEDNRDHVELIRRAIRASDIRLIPSFAYTIQEAVKWLDSHSADVLVVDIHLPDGSGLDFLKEPSNGKPVPAVIITNQGNERHAIEAIKRGAMDYVVKSPENFRQLPAIIQRAYREWQTLQAKQQVEAELNERRNLLISLYRAAPVGLGVIRDFQIVECNATLAMLLGYTMEELLNRDVLQLDPPPLDVAATFRQVEEQLQCENLVEFETDLTRRNGEIIRIRALVTKTRQVGREEIIFSVSDVTPYRRLILDLERKEKFLIFYQTLLKHKIAILEAINQVEDPSLLLDRLMDELAHFPEICVCLYSRPGSPKDDAEIALLDWKVASDEARFGEEDAHRLIEHSRECPPSIQTVAWTQTLPIELRQQFQNCIVLRLSHANKDRGYFYLLSCSEVTQQNIYLDFARSLAMDIGLALERNALLENLQSKQNQLQTAYESTIRAWSKTLQMRDQETEEHTERVADLAARLAQALGVDGEDLRQFRYGALLHDIGKIRIPDRILLKPDVLSVEEFAIMKQHPLFAAELLREIEGLEQAAVIPLYHHERWDGSGYPFGLKGEQIPLWARIFSVVDVWDALLSDRPYRPGWTRSAARQFLAENAGKLFDPLIVETFLKLIE